MEPICINVTHGSPNKEWVARVRARCATGRNDDNRPGPNPTVQQWIIACCQACDGIPDPAAAIREAREALEACMAYMPCSEVHNWPPGFERKRIAIAKAKAALAAFTPKREG